MSDPADANPDLDALLDRGARLRLVFEGLPVEGAASIMAESAERVILTPEGAQWADAAIGGGESLAGIVLEACGVEPPLSSGGVKLLDVLLRAALAAYKRHAAADLAAKRAQGLAE